MFCRSKIARLLVLLLITNGCRKSTVANPPALPAPTTAKSLDPANWMSQHLASLGDRPLKDLTLPASHDAAMYLTSFPQLLGRTQDLNLHDQLQAGVRYFDLRPKWKDNQLYFSHDAITGPKLIDSLNDIRQYMTEGHRELVLLKFSHYGAFTPAIYAQLVTTIQQTLNPWLLASCPQRKRLADMTLNDCIKSTGRIVILCDGSYPLDNRQPGFWVYADCGSRRAGQADLTVFDVYSNTTSYQTMKQDQFDKFNNFNAPCDLFLLSWTLTPPTDVPAFARSVNQHLADDLASIKMPNRFGRRINLLYADCADAHLTEIALRSMGVPPMDRNPK